MSGNSVPWLLILAAALLSLGIWLTLRGFRPRRIGGRDHMRCQMLEDNQCVD